MKRRGHTASHRARKALLALACAVVVAVAVAAVVLGVRYAERSRAVEGVSFSTIQLSPAAGTRGAFTAQIDFTSMASPDGAPVTAQVAWDDAWFFQDPTVYNHQLAHACAVLSAVANAESSHHQAGSEAPSYMENALAALGFEEVSTASYTYRSEIIDEVIDFITGQDDVVAYAVGLKHVQAPDGSQKLLALVAIRGSYGAEWLSDFQILDELSAELAESDHSGFMQACEDMRADLAEIRNQHPDEQTALLVCGHSRGGAAANLLASYADDMTLGLRTLAPLDSIYAYTFATPAVTTFQAEDDPLYDNIFNILNPSDMVPRFPLASWGYARYGRDIWLPGVGDEGFDGRWERAQAAFKQLVGADCPAVPEDRRAVDKLVDAIGAQVPRAEDLASAGGLVSVVGSLATEVNPMQVLYSHYPGVYVAWMEALGADEMSVPAPASAAA